MLRQLPRSFFIGPMRKPKKEVPAGPCLSFTDIAAIERAGCRNLRRLRIESAHRRSDRRNLTQPALRTRSRQHSTMRSQDRHILHKCRVGVRKVRFQPRKNQPTGLQRSAVCLPLRQDLRILRHT